LDSALDSDFRQLQCRPATAAECEAADVGVVSATLVEGPYRPENGRKLSTIVAVGGRMGAAGE
jgi:hypothetical protein